MGRLIIRDPEFCLDYIRPHPNGVYGVYQLTYRGTGVALSAVPDDAPNVTPERVAEALERLQERFPLGALAGWEILCTGRRLFVWDNDPASGHADGMRCPGWIALSSRVGRDLDDLLGHEFAHALGDMLSDTQIEAFWRMIGQEPGAGTTQWHLSPRERLAEYLSAALWGLPIDQPILDHNDPDPTPEVLSQIRQWAVPILGRAGNAQITIGDLPTIVLTIGSSTIWVEGRELQMDVAPFVKDGRAFVPVRFISEGLGRRVDWEPKNGMTERVLIY